jgi:hypothetical protein
MTRIAETLSRATGGRPGNAIVEAIQRAQVPTEGDQLGAFVERNRSLIRDFILIVCGFILFVLVMLFLVLMITLLMNREANELQKEQYKTTVLQNLDVRYRRRSGGGAQKKE